MFQSDSSLQRPIYVGGICDTRIDPCYFHVENEVQRRESVSYDGIGRYCPRGFGYRSNFPVEGMLYEQNVHGTCISGYNQNESQVQFIEDVESQPERESVCSYMTLDRLPENVSDSNRSGNTRKRQYNVVSDDFQTQFENDRYCQVPYGNENTSNYYRYQSEPCVRPVSNFSSISNYDRFIPSVVRQNRNLQNDKKQKDPDTFDGSSVELRDYICHFEQVSRWNNWSESEMATQLVMSLRGNAQRILSELGSAELYNYQMLKAVLVRRFCPPEREMAHRCEFRNRKRKSKESVAEFGYALRRLSSLAYPSLQFHVREGMLLDQYIAGLDNQELRRHVQFAHPQSLDKAISLALEFEAFNATQLGSSKPTDKIYQIGAVRMGQKQDDVRDSQIDQLRKTVENLQTVVQNLTDQKEEEIKQSSCFRSTRDCGEGHVRGTRPYWKRKSNFIGNENQVSMVRSVSTEEMKSILHRMEQLSAETKELSSKCEKLATENCFLRKELSDLKGDHKGNIRDLFSTKQEQCVARSTGHGTVEETGSDTSTTDHGSQTRIKSSKSDVYEKKKLISLPVNAVQVNRNTDRTEIYYSANMKCPVAGCHGNGFKSKRNYTRHWNECHKPHSTTHRCVVPHCHAVCFTRRDMKTHIRRKHGRFQHVTKETLDDCTVRTSNLGYIDPTCYVFLGRDIKFKSNRDDMQSVRIT